MTGVISLRAGADDDCFTKVEGVVGFDEFKVAAVDGETTSSITGGRLLALRGALLEVALRRERAGDIFILLENADVATIGRGCKTVGEGAIEGACGKEGARETVETCAGN